MLTRYLIFQKKLRFGHYKWYIKQIGKEKSRFV